ncbi:uncharacterized protein TNCV_4136821 [Trichonephila clavipes]|nr:uncharacterized protein TNCV_4136821 [Trichonephila clavipes]
MYGSLCNELAAGVSSSGRSEFELSAAEDQPCAGVHVQMFRSSGQPDAKPPVFSSQASLVLIYRSTEATQGLLATDHTILNHGQVTWTTPELAPHQREDVSALDRFSVHRCPTRRVFSGTRARTHDMPAMIRYLDHWATAT